MKLGSFQLKKMSAAASREYVDDTIPLEVSIPMFIIHDGKHAVGVAASRCRHSDR